MLFLSNTKSVKGHHFILWHLFWNVCAVYLDKNMIFFRCETLLQTLQPSPVEGETWTRLLSYRLSLGTAPRRCCPDSCPGRCTRSCGRRSYRFDTWSEFPSTTAGCLLWKNRDKGKVNDVHDMSTRVLIYRLRCLCTSHDISTLTKQGQRAAQKNECFMWSGTCFF